MIDVCNRTYLVTGSTQGIGRAIADAIVNAGGNVVVHGRTQSEVDTVVQKLGKNSAGIAFDLQDSVHTNVLIDFAIATFGALHGLVNSAGVYPRDCVETLSDENFDTIFNINVKTPMFLCKYALPAFRKNTDLEYKGTVLNIGSINALGGLPKISTYSASKGALLTFTRNLAEQWASERIRVNQLNVGWTRTHNEHQTQLNEGNPEHWEDTLNPLIAPWGRIWRPEEVANHTVFYLSDASGPMSGSSYELEQYPLTGSRIIA